MSSSGSRWSVSTSEPRISSAQACAARTPAARIGARSSDRSVSHSAAAAAPAREHSSEISPRCSSAEVKYV